MSKEISGKNVILEMKGIDIQFPGVHALDNVDFKLCKGEIHSLMGENGAGKSTLIKVLTGVHKRNAGTIVYNNEKFNPTSPLYAQQAGINTVYQEINLCDNLTVAENIFAGRQPKKFGVINWKNIYEKAAQALSRLNMHIDTTQLLGSYSVAIKQMVAIARAIDMESKILILDEPTSSLDINEVKELFSIMNKLKSEGMGIIFISHFLDQVYEVSDKITVLRNGKLIGEYEAEKLSKIELISKMVGKELSSLEQKEKNLQNKTDNQTVLEIKSVGKVHEVDPFSLVLHKGETMGFAGLLGSGRTEAANLIFGVTEADEGEIFINGKKVTIKTPRNAIRHRIAFCPEDRKHDGIFYDLTVRENIILALQAKQGITKYISPKVQKQIADKYIEMLGIATPDCEQKAGNLSGGNQQKVILARWLVTEPDILILDEPTRGIDVKAKAEIMNLTMKLCEQGMSIVFISSELEEVIRCSDKISVMRDRKKIAELCGDDLDEKEILKTIANGIEANKEVAK